MYFMQMAWLVAFSAGAVGFFTSLLQIMGPSDSVPTQGAALCLISFSSGAGIGLSEHEVILTFSSIVPEVL